MKKNYFKKMFKEYKDIIKFNIIVQNIKKSLLNERWKKPNHHQLRKIVINQREYFYEMGDKNGGPTAIIHGKKGARYGLFSGIGDELIPVNMKTKKLVKGIGTFRKENDGIIWSRDLSKIDNLIMKREKIKEKRKTHSSPMTEGGKAITHILDKIKEKNPHKSIEISKISHDYLKILFEEHIKPLLEYLKRRKLIKSTYTTDFSLGSSRLAAYIAGFKPKLYGNEDDRVIAKAIQAKKTFGDIDVDVQLEDGVTIEQVGEAIEDKNPSIYSYKKIGKNEISVSVVMDDGKVFQVDIVDVGEHPEHMKFIQSSSFRDISVGLKGYIQKFLLRAVLSVKSLSADHEKLVRDFLDHNPTAQKAIKKGYKPVENEWGGIGRYSLSTESNKIYLVVDFAKEGVKTIKKIKVQDDPILTFSNIKDMVNFILPDIDKEKMYSAIDIAEYIATTFPPREISLIKQRFEKTIKENDSLLSDEEKQAVQTHILSKLTI